MSKKKVLIADKIASEANEVLEKAGIEVINRPGIKRAELKKVIAEYDGVIVRSRTKANDDLFDAAEKLKVVGRAGVGVDNIDLDAAKARGIIVVNTPTSTSLAVAEHTMALILAAARKISQADPRMKSGEWPKNELHGTELAGKILGIVGYGNIGTKVAKRATAFEMRVVAFDPFYGKEEIESRGAEAVGLEDLYEMADIITFHVPLNDSTRGMVNQETIKKMKPGVTIIQAARGGVIDEAALLAALNSGHVNSAGLDVFASEPPGASDLVKHPNVVVTPHIAAQTAEAQIRAAVDVAEEVVNALSGKPLRWQVA